MCDPVTGALIASTVLAAGGTALQYDAQRDAQRDMNDQVAANNRRMQEQYALRRAQENAAKDQIDVRADRETEAQAEFSEQKQSTLADQVLQFARESQEESRQQAVDRRMDTFDQAAIGLTESPTTSQGPRIIQDRARTEIDRADQEGRSMVAALSGLGAMGDVGVRNAQGMSDMGRAFDDIARNSRDSLGLSNLRIGGLNRSIAANSGRPYETVPLNPKPGVSGVGTLMSGLGDIGMTAAMMSTPKQKPLQSLSDWINTLPGNS